MAGPDHTKDCLVAPITLSYHLDNKGEVVTSHLNTFHQSKNLKDSLPSSTLVFSFIDWVWNQKVVMVRVSLTP